MTIETLSEKLFKRHCESRGVPYRRIPETGCKVADFEVYLNSSTVVAEVKQFDPNSSDIARESLSSGELADGTNSPANRLRNLLSDAYRQIKPYSKQGIPGIVICYNNAGLINYIDNFTVTRAMFGGMAIYLGLGKDGIIRNTGQGFTRQRKVTRNTCRGLSAVCVLTGPKNGHTKLVAYHNPYAINPLTPDLLKSIADRQFGYVDPHGQSNPSFLAHELEV